MPPSATAAPPWSWTPPRSRPPPFSLVCAQAVQTLLLGGWLAWRDRCIVGALLRAWRPSLLAGFMGAAASVGWFSAMALEPAAHVRTLGLVELFFAYALSFRLFRERLSRREIAGIALLLCGMAAIMLGL